MSDTETERPRPAWRQWRIPNRIYGRVRTSTVALGICFVLTGLLYGQLNADVTARNQESVEGPTAVDPAQTVPTDRQQTYEPTYSVTSTPVPTSTSTTDTEQTGTVEESGQQAPTSTVAPTTTEPFDVTLPPAIQSLIPSQPAPTSAR